MTFVLLKSYYSQGIGPAYWVSEIREVWSRTGYRVR